MENAHKFFTIINRNTHSERTMPSGYLKRQPGIGKRSRGSSSHTNLKRPTAETRGHKVRHWDRHTPASPDFSLEPFSSHASKIIIAPARTKQSSTNVGYCCICCEDRAPLVKLFHNCKHELACRTCLRTIHIKQAQADVTQYSNLMKCFHPSCQLKLSDAQIQRLVNNQSEFTRHQRLSILSRSYKIPGSTTVHCPSCDHPCQFTSKSLLSESSSNVGGKLHNFVCRTCRKVSWFTTDRTTNQLKMLDEQALQQERNRLAELRQVTLRFQKVMQRIVKRKEKENFKNVIKVIGEIQMDNVGRNDGWALCPRCKIMISKGDGCYHMTCVCGREFHWERLG
jgi:hypothetical protein